MECERARSNEDEDEVLVVTAFVVDVKKTFKHTTTRWKPSLLCSLTQQNRHIVFVVRFVLLEWFFGVLKLNPDSSSSLETVK